MREAIKRVLDHPGSASVEYTPKGEEGRYYGDFFLWRRDPDFKNSCVIPPYQQLQQRF